MEVEQIVFEVRYHFGTLYLDRCGRIIRELTRAESEWILQDATPKCGVLVSSVNGVALNFSSAKIDLSLQRSGAIGSTGLDSEAVGTFIAQVGRVVPRILDRLDIEGEMISRVGCRTIVSFPMSDEAKCEEWISAQKIYNVSGFKAFEDGRLKNSSAVVVIEGGEVSHRISIATAEHPDSVDAGPRRIEVKSRHLPRGQREALVEQLRKQKANQLLKWAVLLDVDTFKDDPGLIEPDMFVRSSVEKVMSFGRNLIKSRA